MKNPAAIFLTWLIISLKPSTSVDGNGFFQGKETRQLSSTKQSLQLPLTSVNGLAQGTTYSLKYYDEKSRNFKPEIDSILAEFDQSLSLYKPGSELSNFNQGTAFSFKLPYFFPVLTKSQEIYRATHGAFDPTIMPLVEAYGFGSKKVKNPELTNVDSLLKLVGFDKIEFDPFNVRKTNPALQLDFNGIAQGYSVDVLGMFLESQNISDYMVEIGGEVLSKGRKSDGSSWRAGIEDPMHPVTLIGTVDLHNMAMTTAGNYRNHFTRNGQVFNHIINPKTGSMEQSSLLSVTVFAKDAITADGYDTAFFVMGAEATKDFLAKQNDLQAYLIYTNASGAIETFATPGIKDFIKEKITQ